MKQETTKLSMTGLGAGAWKAEYDHVEEAKCEETSKHSKSAYQRESLVVGAPLL